MDLYEILELDRHASVKQIKAAFRKLSKESHPDISGKSELFMKQKEAYQVLSDKKKRTLYDDEGIIVNDSAEQMAEWVVTHFSEFIRVWLINRIDPDKQVPPFDKYIRKRLHDVHNSGLTRIRSLEGQKKSAIKYREYASVGEGDNVFKTQVQRIIDELDGAIRETNLTVYRNGLLLDELKKYTFETEEEAVQYIMTMGNHSAYTSTSTTTY